MAKTNKKYTWIVGTTLLLAVLGSAHAEKCDSTIIGTGDPAVDVPELQFAIDAGGIVCVSGSVAFSNEVPPAIATCVEEYPGGQPNLSQVCIDPEPGVTHVALVGIDKKNKATLSGGFAPILIPASANVEFIRIDNLRGVGATAWFLLSTNGDGNLSVTNVDVEGVTPFISGGLIVQTGMQVSSATEDVSATVIFADNTIEAALPDLSQLIEVPQVGIAAYGNFGILPGGGEWTGRLEVIDNRTANWGANGIAAISVAEAHIEGNVVQTGPHAFRAQVTGPHPCALPLGLGFASGIAWAGPGKASLIDNAVILDPATTASGEVRCQAGLILTEAEGVRVEEFKVDASAPNAEGIVVVDSSSSDIQDFLVISGGVGISTLGSNSIRYVGGNIKDTAACLHETLSSNISYIDINCK